MLVTITRVSNKTADKDGKPYIGKNGRPYTRASIQTQEHGQEWLGGFGNSALVVGAQVDIEITEREWNGKTYKNFELVSEKKKADMELEEIKNKITGLTIRVTALEQMVQRLKVYMDVQPMEEEPGPDF